MGHARFRVSLEALKYALHLPEEYKILSAHASEIDSGTIDFLIGADSIPEQQEDEFLPTLYVNYSAEWLSPEQKEYRKITAMTEIKRQKRATPASDAELLKLL